MNLAWFLPILSGAADAASRSVIKMTREIHNFSLVAGGFLGALPYYALWLYFVGIPEVGPHFWAAVAVHVPLLALANILIVEAHRSSPMMLVVPLLALTPALTLLSSPLMGAGKPSVLGGSGVLLIVVGLYILNTKKEEVGWFGPIRALAREKGPVLMLIVNVIFAVTSNLDYIAFTNANAPFYLLVDHGSAGFLMLGLAFLYGATGRAKTTPPRGALRVFALYGMFIAASVAGHMLAFEWISTVPYVIALKRSGAIGFATVFAVAMAARKHRDFERELENLKTRALGILAMVAGMLVVILWGKA